MSDRPGTEPPREQDDHDLDYLDAAVSESFDEDRRTPEPVVPDPSVQRTERVETTATALPPPAAVQPARTVVVEKTAADTSWYWPVINLVGLLAVIAVNYLANALEFNDQSTGDVVNKDPVPFQPAGWVFSIWGVIYLLLLAFTIYGVTPGGRRNERLQRVSPFFLVANVANALWIVLWHWEQFAASMVTILALLVSLLLMYVGLRVRRPFRGDQARPKPSWVERIALRIPVSVYLGWIMVASLANLMVWLDRSGWDGGSLSYPSWAVVFMLGGTIVASLFVFTVRDIFIPLVMAVAFVGIAQHNWGDSTLVSVMAVVFSLVCLAMVAVAWIMDYDRTNNRNPFGRSSGTPPPMTPVE